MSDDQKDAKALAKPNEPAAAEQPRTRYITLPADRAGQRKAIKKIFLDVVGAAVFSVEMRKFLTGDFATSETTSNNNVSLRRPRAS